MPGGRIGPIAFDRAAADAGHIDAPTHRVVVHRQVVVKVGRAGHDAFQWERSVIDAYRLAIMAYSLTQNKGQLPLPVSAGRCKIRSTMNHVERFRAVMNFQPVDRLPRWEWAMWWDKTIERWKTEGLPGELSEVIDIARYFGLDPYQQYWFSTTDPTIGAVQHHVEGIVSNMDDYLRVRPQLYPDHSAAIESMRPWAALQARGDAVVWISLEGFFWFPRTLMGFTKISLAFYDQPELLHRINRDLTEFNLKILDQLEKVCLPTFATIAEDMSYNHGPMISERVFDEFIAPYYRRIVPRLQEMGAMVIVDTDGDVTQHGALADARGHSRRAALGAAGRRGWHEIARAISRASHGGALRQDDDAPRRGRHARGIRAAASLDRLGRFHSERRSPNAARRFDGFLPRIPPPAG